jgi:crotonobetainyl-CoA:carnitine CoA-transferase CaiB-like acyl-CoA transferase
VTCEITGYGRDGPYVSRKAYDLLVQAEVGLCSITGAAGEPARVGLSLCDIATGLTAFSAILRALLLRFRTGQGIDLSISMFDVLADWMNVPLLFYRYAGVTPQRMGVHHPGLAPYGLYASKDGEGLLISIQSDREWRIFAADILNRPELGSDPRFARSPDRVANRAALNAEIDSVFSRLPRADLMDMLLTAKIACAQLSDMKDLERHPQLRDLEIVGENGVPVRVADLPVRIDRPRPAKVPALDEHGAALRAEFGA